MFCLFCSTLYARQVANVVPWRWTALHVARSDLHEPILGAGATSKFVGDLGWSSFAVGSLCACSAAISAFGNWNQHVDVQSGARPLWRGAFGPGQGSNRDVPKVFAQQLVCLSVLPELVCLVQWHAWPVAAPADCVDLCTWAGRFSEFLAWSETQQGCHFRWQPSRSTGDVAITRWKREAVWPQVVCFHICPFLENVQGRCCKSEGGVWKAKPLKANENYWSLQGIAPKCSKVTRYIIFINFQRPLYRTPRLPSVPVHPWAAWSSCVWSSHSTSFHHLPKNCHKGRKARLGWLCHCMAGSHCLHHLAAAFNLANGGWLVDWWFVVCVADFFCRAFFGYGQPGTLVYSNVKEQAIRRSAVQNPKNRSQAAISGPIYTSHVFCVWKLGWLQVDEVRSSSAYIEPGKC